VKKLNELWSNVCKSLKINVRSFISSNNFESFQSWFSCQLKLKFFSVQLNNTVDFLLTENLVGNLNQLSHGDDAAVLDFLIDVASLKFVESSGVEAFDTGLVILV